MKIQKQPDYLIFADSAKKGENAEFPDISRGWGITTEQTASKPPMEWMNGAFNRIDKNMLYLLQQGVPEWSEKVTYPVNAIIKCNGVLYTAIEENNNAIPTTNTNKWKKSQAEIPIASTIQKGVVQLSSKIDSELETVAATSLAVKKVNDNANNAHNRISEVDNRAAIANANAISANSNANNAHNRINDIHDKFEPCANESRIYSHDKRFYVIVRDDGVVGHLNVGQKKITWAFDGNGNLFEGFVPANRVTGFYESVANTFNQSFGGNGYTKLPTGMIIQWGTAKSLGSTGANGTLQPFFITFPNACLLVTTNDIGNGVNSTSAAVFSNSQFRCWGKTPYGGAAYTDTAMNYIAIGF